MTQNNQKDIERLEKILSDLSITLSEGSNGRITAFTTTEPLFCVVRDDVDSVNVAIKKILLSYAKHFHNVSANVILDETPVSRSKIPADRVKPIKQLSPRRSSGGKQPTGLAHALG